MNQDKPSIGYGTYREYQALLDCDRSRVSSIMKNAQRAGKARHLGEGNFELDLYYAGLQRQHGMRSQF
jgi:hypothetical protein